MPPQMLHRIDWARQAQLDGKITNFVTEEAWEGARKAWSEASAAEVRKYEHLSRLTGYAKIKQPLALQDRPSMP